jgi:hypothetical protein
MSVLLIGLNDLSKKIIEYLKVKNVNILGFDFDVDKIELFCQNGLIKNDAKVILEDLLKQSDIIILNVELLRYCDIFKLSPFIKSECAIINTNSFKETNNFMRKILNNRFDNFLPCGFVFFPKNVTMNFNTDLKMSLISSLSSFFKSVNIKTSILTLEENNDVFSKMYHIPFLLDKILFKINNSTFISDDNIFDCTYEDIILNKENVLINLKNLISHIPDSKHEDKTLDLLDENILLVSNNSNNKISRAIFGKVLIEKIMINLFHYRYLKTYVDNLNLDYANYDRKYLKNYYTENKEDIEILLLLLREKISNLISFLELDALNSNKLKRYLEA